MNEKPKRGRPRTAHLDEVDMETGEVEVKIAPQPQDRAIKSGMVRVRANRPIAEFNSAGEMVRYATGAEFDLDEQRANALGALVKRV